MRSSLRFCAILSGVITSSVTMFIGCTTPAVVRDVPSEPSASRTPAPTEAPSRDGGVVTNLPESASIFLNEGLSDRLEPVIVGDAAAAGWFYPVAVNDADAGISAPGALGLYASVQSLDLAYRSGSASSRSAGGATQLSQLMPHAGSLRVRVFETVHLRVGSSRPSGFRLRFSGEHQDEEMFVLWTARPENPLYIMRLPITSVRRTALRDLTGDGLREMVYLSVVFNAQGSREIIADALRWDSTQFVHVGSVSLIQAINDQLASLEQQLQAGNDEEWIAAANAALHPIEESLPVGPLLPAENVRVPRINELSLDLGQGEWRFFHDIAVEGNLYRLRIHLEANPLLEHPARIDGIQGL